MVPGPGRISACIIKEVVTSHPQELLSIIKHPLANDLFHPSWKRAKLVLRLKYPVAGLVIKTYLSYRIIFYYCEYG